MTQAAYWINGETAASERFYEVACDPQRSVVVEACAGAGKTWMLVSRILRALLDGVAPNQILAITFTRKAAGEMRERLHQWLREFAQNTDAEREQALMTRGLSATQAREAAPRLGQLYRHWLDEGRSVEIHTIHGWFSRLLRAAPLDALAELGLPPELNLVEDTSEFWPELWGRFLRRLDKEGHAAERDVFVSLVREVGRSNTEGWLSTALSNRMEISLADQAGHLDDGVPCVADWSPEWAGLDDPAQALLREAVRQPLLALAGILGQAKGVTMQKAAAQLIDALSCETPALQHKALVRTLFTDKGEPRKRLGDSAELAWAQGWLAELELAVQQAQAAHLHQCMCTLSRALFEEYRALKAQRGQVDMVDLELAASHLLGDSTVSGWIQERLDTQVRQLLMDEFQDTSPLQWQTLKSWLGGYAGAGGGASGQQGVRVFLVGDPKQSIYRFRRADPRVFEAAKQFIIDGLQGSLLACDHTRRNAPGVIDALNQVMGAAVHAGEFEGFRAHSTGAQAPARIRVLPEVLRLKGARADLADKGDAGEDPSQGYPSPEGANATPDWRDSLSQPRLEAETRLKQLEAEHVAAAIEHMVRYEGVGAQDIHVLSRKRAQLRWVAEALQRRGIAHVAPDDTPLIETPEVRDLMALVEALISPQMDLSLAHALKSPIFGATDLELTFLAEQVRSRTAPGEPRPTWWDALQQWPDAPPTLRDAAQHLLRWQAVARHAPPHDLIETVLTEGQVRQRVLASVPASDRDQALAHLDALLAQSLAMDGGRDATPYRWLRALKRLAVTLPARPQAGAVQLLTIHGAKGLEAKVVFVVDSDAESPKPRTNTVLVDWPETEARPLRFAFVKSEGKPAPSLASAIQEERLAQRREELNALYVALTRAREQLVFSRTQPHHSDKSGSWWMRLWDSGAVQDEHRWVPPEVPIGEGGLTPETGAETTRTAGAQPVRWLGLPVLPPLPLQPEFNEANDTRHAGEDSGTLDLALLGQVVHKSLEWLTCVPRAQRPPERVSQVVRAAAQALGAQALLAEQARLRVNQVLDSAELQPWLDPAALSWAGNEVGLIHEGCTLRIDRLVARASETGLQWWVLDYKLQHQPQQLPAYQAQLRQYVAAIRALQPGDEVRAAFITGDGRLVEMPDASQPAS